MSRNKTIAVSLWLTFRPDKINDERIAERISPHLKLVSANTVWDKKRRVRDMSFSADVKLTQLPAVKRAAKQVSSWVGMNKASFRRLPDADDFSF